MTAPPPKFRRRTAAEVDERVAALDFMGHWTWPRAGRPYRVLTECPAAEDVVRRFLTGDIDSRTASAVRSWCYSLRGQRWVPE